MGTEVALSFSALRTQLESEKSSLYKIDENIKKIVQTSGRFQNDRFNNSQFNNSGDYGRGQQQRLGGRHYTDSNSFNKNDDPFGKRKHETKTVFSRLSARTNDSDGEDDGPKRSRVSSTVSRELPTRAAVLKAQGNDEQSRTRNRRIFGSLLGTLQKFKQEEIVLQTKEDKKAQVEKKIEEQARQQKEKEQKERKTLFAEREQKKATIKALEAKMGRVQEFEKWEASQKHLGNFILTKTKPHIYWLPKKMSEKANERLISSRKFHEKCMAKKRLELQDELLRIENRCLRIRGPGMKENDPDTHDIERKISEPSETDQDDKAKKRDKFAMDVDEKEKDESDVEDKQNDIGCDEDGDYKMEDIPENNTVNETTKETSENKDEEKPENIADSTVTDSASNDKDSQAEETLNIEVDNEHS